MSGASAGMRGGDVRSDAWIQVSHAPGAPPTIEIQSKVHALYGDSIRALIESTLGELDASDLSVVVHDTGALPFTLMARIEAAVKRLRPTYKCALPQLNPQAQYDLPHQHPRRSRLYLPGNTPKFFINAGLYRADGIILDVEDSVPPAEKDAGRILVRNALRAVNFYGAEKSVRVNALPWGLEDIRELAAHGVHTFHLPKVESADQVIAAAELLDSLNDANEGSRNIALMPLVESARGVMNAYAIASASPRVTAIALGLEDYLRDIGAEQTPDARASWWALGQVVNAARSAQVVPLASVYTRVDDEQGMLEWAREMRRMGFEGVGCLHPRQARIANHAFAPSSQELEHAARLVAEYERALETGVGAVRVDDAMVDAPVVERARRILRRADAT
jgi:citrate lyase subunit beta/citryl-CoA lyase